MEHLHHQNLQQHATETQVLVLFTASNYWQRDLSAFDNMVLSAAAPSRLPWRRDSTISLPRLASNITVPTFSYNIMFLLSHKSVLLFWKIKSRYHQCYLFLRAEVPKLSLKEIIMDSNWDSSMACVQMCENMLVLASLNMAVSWDFYFDTCKFQSTVVVTTDFLYWEIYICIFIYQFLIIWIGYNILYEIVTGSKRTRNKWLLFLIHFPLAFFAEGAFLIRKTMVDLFTTVSSISLCRIWQHFGSDAVGSGCAV